MLAMAWMARGAPQAAAAWPPAQAAGRHAKWGEEDPVEEDAVAAAADEEWPAEDEYMEEAPRTPPLAASAFRPTGRPMAVKRELGVKPEMGGPAKIAGAGETDREARLRAKMEAIRAEAAGGPAPPAQAAAAGAAGAGAAPGRRPQAPQGPPPKPQPAGAKAPAGPPPMSLGAKRKAEAMAEKKEEEDAQKLERFLPPLEEKIQAVEEEAERVGILSAPLEMDPTAELKDVQLTAVRETERAVKVAQGKLATVTREMEQKKKEVASFAPMAKESATEELARLTARVDAVKAKVEEHKNARKDHELAVATERLFDELAGRLASVEMDCEKASMMAEPLAKALDQNPQDISVAEIREAKEALRLAQATLLPTSRLVAGKLTGLKGAMRDKMAQLKERAEAAQSGLDKATKTVDEAQSRAAAAPIMSQAVSRMATVEDVLAKMRETEGPFLMGVETFPGEEGVELLAKCDKAAALAQSAVLDAHKYVSLKLVEVGRLAESAHMAARGQMEGIKAQLDEAMERVRQFQEETGKRRRASLAENLRCRLEEAEAALERLKAAEEKAMSAAPGELREHLEEALAAEVEAQGIVVTARREAQESVGGKLDAKKDSASVQAKVRVNYMEAELLKFRKVAKEMEERIRVSTTLGDLVAAAAEAEDEATRLGDAADLWHADNVPPQEDETSVRALQAKITSSTTQVERKQKTAQGMELKELRALFGRLKTSQVKLDRVKQKMKAMNRAESMRTVNELSEAVKKADERVAELTEAAAAPLKLSLERMEDLHQESAGVLADVAQTLRQLKGAHDDGALLEAKVELARLQLKCKGADRKAKASVDVLKRVFEEASADATEKLLDALRAAARQEDGSCSADALCSMLKVEDDRVTEPLVTDFLLRTRPDLPDDRVRFAMRRLAPHGISRQGLAGLLEEFMKAVREVTITDEFDIQTAKKVVKLGAGDFVEIIGEAEKDPKLGLSRAKCRVVRDNVSGWVTLGQSSGTKYMERAQKPRLWCRTSTNLTVAIEADSAPVRELRSGEVLELLEGPKDDKIGIDTRVRGIACHEESSGWLQVTDAAGTVLARLSDRVYKCQEAIAMTDLPDFENCNMVRRIEVGEALELLADDVVQPSEGGTRQKFRACRDNAEGWVTVKGSQGSQYLRKQFKHYLCIAEAPLHSTLGAASPVERVLMVGEAFCGYGEVEEVSGGDCRTHYRVRASADGAMGWVASGEAGSVRPWRPLYKVAKAVALTRALSCNEAVESIEVIRFLQPGDYVEALEAPTDDRSTSTLRVWCAVVGQTAAGWATVREGVSPTAQLYLSPADEGDEADTGVAGEAAQCAAPLTPPLGNGAGGKNGGGKADGKGGKASAQGWWKVIEAGGKATGKGGEAGGKNGAMKRPHSPGRDAAPNSMQAKWSKAGKDGKAKGKGKGKGKY